MPEQVEYVVSLKIAGGGQASAILSDIERLGHKVEVQGVRAGKALGTIDDQLRGLKGGLGRVAGAGLAIDGIVRSLDAAANRWGKNNDAVREFTGSLVGMANAARSFDVAGFAAGLGQALGTLSAANWNWARDVEQGTTSASRGMEEARNAARILAAEGFDVARMSAGSLIAKLEELFKKRFDLKGQILGDPAALEAQVADLAKVTKKLEFGGDFFGSDRYTGIVRGLMDEFEQLGRSAPAELQKIADKYGILSTKGQEAATATAEAWNRQREEAARAQEAEQARLKALRDSLDPIGNQLSSIAEREGYLADQVRKGTIETEAALRAWENLNRERGALSTVAELPMLEIADRNIERVEIKFKELSEFPLISIQEKGYKPQLIEIEQRAENIAKITGTWVPTSKFEDVKDDFKDFQKWIAQDFWGGVKGSGSQFLFDVLDGSKSALSDFGDSLSDILKRTVADYITEWAAAQVKLLALSLQRIAKEAAAERAMGVGKGGGGKGKGGGVDASTATGLLGKQSMWSGGASSVGVAMIGIAVVAGVAAYMKHQSSKARGEKYGTFASYGAGGGSWGGKLDQTGPAAMRAMSDLFHGMQEVTGAGIVEMERATILIKNKKHGFRAVVGGEIVGYFKTFEEALIAATKKAFLDASLSKDLDPAVRQAIEGYKGKDPNELLQQVQYVQGIVDAISGLSEMELTLQRIPGQINSMKQSLLEMGLAASEAERLSGMWGVSQYRQAWESISGYQPSPQEQMAIKKQEQAMLVASMKLTIAELNLRKHKLEADISMAKIGFGLARQEMLVGVNQVRGRAALVESEAQLTNVQFGVWNEYLGGRGELIEAEAKLLNAELEAIGLVITEMEKLLGVVSGGKIRLGSGGGLGGGIPNVGGAGGFGGGGSRNSTTFWDTLLGPNSALSPEKQMEVARSRYDFLRRRAASGGAGAKDAFEEFATQFLEEAGSFWGTATEPYAGLFEEVTKDMARLGVASRDEQRARAAAIESLYGLSSAADAVSRAMGTGNSRRTNRSGSQRRAAAASTAAAAAAAGLNPLAAALGAGGLGAGGFGAQTAASFGGGSSTIVTELRSGTQATVASIEEVANQGRRRERRERRETRQTGGTGRTRRGGGGDPTLPPPPPAPTPPVLPGVGRGGGRVGG